MTLPEDMNDPYGRRIRALEKEVASLRGRNPLASATLDDEDGNRRINFGQLPDGGFGQEILDTSGRTVFRVDEGGLRHPGLNLPYRQAGAPGAVSVTGAGWVDCWETSIGYRAHPAIRWSSQVAVAAGSAFQARLSLNLGVDGTTAVLACPGGVSTRVAWSWAPPSGWAVGHRNTYVIVQLEVQRVSGTGSADVYAPDELFTATVADIEATPTGV